MARQKVGEIESAGLGVVQPSELCAAGEQFIAVRAGQTLDAFLGEHFIQLPAAAAVGIGGEHATVTPAVFADFVAHRRGDALGRVVQFGRQALDVEMRPAAGRAHAHQLMRQRAAGDD